MATNLHYNANKEFTWGKFKQTLNIVNDLNYISLNCYDYFLQRNKLDESKKHIVFRVDVDRSVNKSLIMAEILRQYQIEATFFYRLHSRYYNLLSFNSLEKLKRVKGLDFEIGLHTETLDGAYATNQKPSKFLKKDVDILNTIIGEPIKGTASHRDSSGINNLDFWDDHTPDQFNLKYEAYDPKTFGLFQEGTYISESPLLHWKVYRLRKEIENDYRILSEHLQEEKHDLVYVLIHPFLFRERHYFEES